MIKVNTFLSENPDGEIVIYEHRFSKNRMKYYK